MMQMPDYTGTKDPHTQLSFRLNEEGEGIFIRTVGDHDQPYTWGRAKKALRSSLPDFQYARMQLMRLRYLDRIINANIRTEDPDGPCQ